MTVLPDDLLRRILDGSPDAILISVHEGTVGLWNAYVTERYGREKALRAQLKALEAKATGQT